MLQFPLTNLVFSTVLVPSEYGEERYLAVAYNLLKRQWDWRELSFESKKHHAKSVSKKAEVDERDWQAVLFVLLCLLLSFLGEKYAIAVHLGIWLPIGMAGILFLAVESLLIQYHQGYTVYSPPSRTEQKMYFKKLDESTVRYHVAFPWIRIPYLSLMLLSVIACLGIIPLAWQFYDYTEWSRFRQPWFVVRVFVAAVSFYLVPGLLWHGLVKGIVLWRVRKSLEKEEVYSFQSDFEM